MNCYFCKRPIDKKDKPVTEKYKGTENHFHKGCYEEWEAVAEKLVSRKPP